MSVEADPLVTYLLRIGDDNLILAQRLGEEISSMPDLEEDIAVANVCLDHLGQARNFYAYAGEREGADRDEDDFAMLREEREFFNAVLVEQPNGDFGQLMARQLFVDAYQVPLYEALTDSADETLAGIAGKAAKEARYHLRRSASWVVRLGDGTSESHVRIQAGIATMWPFTADLFVVDDVEESLLVAGVGADVTRVRERFDATVVSVLTEATLDVPGDEFQRVGGRTGFHTEQLGHLLPEMQSLHRLHHGASW